MARWESRDKNYSSWENLFSCQAKIFSFWKGIGNKNHVFDSLRLPLFLPRYITLKLNQNIISKISNYLTLNTFLIHLGNLPLKEISFNQFKLTRTKTKQISEPSFFKGSCFKILHITAQILSIRRFSRTLNGISVKLLELFKIEF